MKSAGVYEPFITGYMTTRRRNIKYHNINFHRHENLKYNITYKVYIMLCATVLGWMQTTEYQI